MLHALVMNSEYMIADGLASVEDKDAIHFVIATLRATAQQGEQAFGVVVRWEGVAGPTKMPIPGCKHVRSS